ncbi:MAG: L-ribulose-5-phosphate 4-epimerase AraD [Puniceicoccaceae bacterium]
MNYLDIRTECVAANKALQAAGLIDLTFGNASVLDAAEKVFAIKPSGVPYEELVPESMVIVSLDGTIVEGDLRPSSDEPTHRRLLQAFMDRGIRSVVHTHSRNAVAFAQAEQSIPCLGTTHADYFNGSVPVTREMRPDEVNRGYEWETGNVIVETLGKTDPNEISAALVRSHGPFVWGSSGPKAVEIAIALEAIADMAVKTLSLKPKASGAPDHIRKKHFLRKHGAEAYYGQPK